MKCSRKISESTLESIKYIAEDVGHLKAVRQALDLPEANEEDLKRWAISNYTYMATGQHDGYFLERCWVCAYGAVLKISFKFPHIDPYICIPNEMPAREPEE